MAKEKGVLRVAIRGAVLTYSQATLLPGLPAIRGKPWVFLEIMHGVVEAKVARQICTPSIQLSEQSFCFHNYCWILVIT